MISFGIEGIFEFDFARNKGSNNGDVPLFAETVCEDLEKGLKKYSHTGWFLPNDYCQETDLRDKTKRPPRMRKDGEKLIIEEGTEGPFGKNKADSVDLFFIMTHGNNYEGEISLSFNTNKDFIDSWSFLWRLGKAAGGGCKWFIMYACSTLNLDHVLKLRPIFQGLHMLCGAYDSMVSSFTTDESGEDLCDNLCKYNKPVADAWIEAVEDRVQDNHPMVVAAEKRDSIDPITGRADWSSTTMSQDHIHGHGPTMKNISNSDIHWMSVKWKEVYLLKQRRVQI